MPIAQRCFRSGMMHHMMRAYRRLQRWCNIQDCLAFPFVLLWCKCIFHYRTCKILNPCGFRIETIAIREFLSRWYKWAKVLPWATITWHREQSSKIHIVSLEFLSLGLFSHYIVCKTLNPCGFRARSHRIRDRYFTWLHVYTFAPMTTLTNAITTPSPILNAVFICFSFVRGLFLII